MRNTYHIAKRMALSEPKPIGWGSTDPQPMSHDKPLTERQFHFLRNCGVLRTDEEVEANDRRERNEG